MSRKCRERTSSTDSPLRVRANSGFDCPALVRVRYRGLTRGSEPSTPTLANALQGPSPYVSRNGPYGSSHVSDFPVDSGAGEGIRTLDPNLGKVPTGSQTFAPYCLELFADAHRMARQPEAALQKLAEAEEMIGVTYEGSFEAEVHRLRGELLHGAGARFARRFTSRRAKAQSSGSYAPP
jgi:hypothetical protein